jgi:ABC-type uncharacterized transport system auxiliary subunit
MARCWKTKKAVARSALRIRKRSGFFADTADHRFPGGLAGGPMRQLILAVLVLALTGCGAARNQVPDTRFYTLEYDSPVVEGEPTEAVIGLSRFGAAPEFGTAAMVYRDLSFGRQQYTYHQWRAAPQVLAADYLRRDMQASGLFLAVAGPGSALPVTHRLEGMVEEWMEVDGEDGWQATAELTVTLLDLRAEAVPDLVLFQRTYRASEPSAKKNPGSVVEAMSRVMRILSERIIADVHAATRE